MDFKFVPMNSVYAREMIDNWKYGAEYQIYDYVNEEELLLEAKNWGMGKFAALNEDDILVGELTVDFFRPEETVLNGEDDYVEHAVVRNNPDADYEMWAGWGLRPDLCGKGIGARFVSECLNFAVNEYKYTGEYVRCGVASFNERAVKTYKKLNFEIFRVCEGEIADKKHEILHMRKKLK
jgi:ribosomal-protein-alanine N-acetyltransferase